MDDFGFQPWISAKSAFLEKFRESPPHGIVLMGGGGLHHEGPNQEWEEHSYDDYDEQSTSPTSNTLRKGIYHPNLPCLRAA
mmetsp:Transcript_8359/g.17399  ORF Transcript_8359/g.17399 Transcript_8359/m.17399 type:complete len:81 (+) Transcript_8359:452-694(+)